MLFSWHCVFILNLNIDFKRDHMMGINLIELIHLVLRTRQGVHILIQAHSLLKTKIYLKMISNVITL